MVAPRVAKNERFLSSCTEDGDDNFIADLKSRRLHCFMLDVLCTEKETNKVPTVALDQHLKCLNLQLYYKLTHYLIVS